MGPHHSQFNQVRFNLPLSIQNHWDATVAIAKNSGQVIEEKATELSEQATHSLKNAFKQYATHDVFLTVAGVLGGMALAPVAGVALAPFLMSLGGVLAGDAANYAFDLHNGTRNSVWANYEQKNNPECDTFVEVLEIYAEQTIMGAATSKAIMFAGGALMMFPSLMFLGRFLEVESKSHVFNELYEEVATDVVGLISGTKIGGRLGDAINYAAQAVQAASGRVHQTATHFSTTAKAVVGHAKNQVAQGIGFLQEHPQYIQGAFVVSAAASTYIDHGHVAGLLSAAAMMVVDPLKFKLEKQSVNQLLQNIDWQYYNYNSWDCDPNERLQNYRLKEKAALKKIITDTASLSTQSVFIILEGQSGVGKSTLVRQMLAELSEQQKARVVVLNENYPLSDQLLKNKITWTPGQVVIGFTGGGNENTQDYEYDGRWNIGGLWVFSNAEAQQRALVANQGGQPGTVYYSDNPSVILPDYVNAKILPVVLKPLNDLQLAEAREARLGVMELDAWYLLTPFDTSDEKMVENIPDLSEAESQIFNWLRHMQNHHTWHSGSPTINESQARRVLPWLLEYQQKFTHNQTLLELAYWIDRPEHHQLTDFGSLTRLFVSTPWFNMRPLTVPGTIRLLGLLSLKFPERFSCAGLTFDTKIFDSVEECQEFGKQWLRRFYLETGVIRGDEQLGEVLITDTPEMTNSFAKWMEPQIDRSTLNSAQIELLNFLVKEMA